MCASSLAFKIIYIASFTCIDFKPSMTQVLRDLYILRRERSDSLSWLKERRGDNGAKSKRVKKAYEVY